MKGAIKLGRWLALWLASGVVATSCVTAAETDTGSSGSGATTSAATTASTGPPVEPAPREPVTVEAEPGTLIWVHDQEPASLHSDDPENPADVASWIRQSLTEGLFGIDAANEYYPELLASEPVVEQRNSGTVVIDYRLRDGLRWSDGEPLTAEDVAYTHRIIVEGCQVETDRSIVDSSDEGCEYDLAGRFGYELVTDFEVVSDTEFRVIMASFFAGWRSLYDQVMAEHAFGATARDVNQSMGPWSGPNGPLPSSGPLLFDRWEPGVAIHLVRNDGYHGSVSPDATTTGPAAVAGVLVRFVGPQEDRIDLLTSGQAHLMMTPAELGLEVLAASDAFTVASAPGPIFEHLSLNLLNVHLAKPEVRLAIAAAIDKGRIVDDLYRPMFGDAVPAAGLGNVFWMTNQQLYEDHQSAFVTADTGAAATALREAGYARSSDGIWAHPVDGPLSLRLGTTGGVRLREAQQELVAGFLADAGIEVVIDNEPGGLFFTEGPFAPAAIEASASEGRDGDGDLWDLALFSWTSGPWPGTMSGVFRAGSTANPYGFSNPAFDVAANDCDATVDDGERAACYNRLDRFVTTLDEGDDGLVVIPLTQRPRFFGYSTTLASGAVAPDVVRGGPLVNVVDYRLAEVTTGG